MSQEKSNEPGPALQDAFEEIQEAAPKMMFEAATNNPQEEKVAEGIRQELFACFVMAGETVRVYHQSRATGSMDKDTISMLNERATSITIRLNNVMAAIMEGKDPREMREEQSDDGDEPDSTEPSNIIT